jgi:hypothetical protein
MKNIRTNIERPVAKLDMAQKFVSLETSGGKVFCVIKRTEDYVLTSQSPTSKIPS